MGVVVVDAKNMKKSCCLVTCTSRCKVVLVADVVDCWWLVVVVVRRFANC